MAGVTEVGTELLRLADVGFQYPRGPKIVRKLSAAVGRASITAIMGSSGVGKTTLLKLVAGLLQPTEGKIQWNTPQGERPTIDFIFQDLTLFPWLTAIENVRTGLLHSGATASNTDEAAAVFADVGLRGFEGKFPHELSGGMRQRVAIARAMYRRAVLTLLDEPFSALDLATQQVIIDLLRSVNETREMTMLLVTHSVGAAAKCAGDVLIFPGVLSAYKAVKRESKESVDDFRKRIESAIVDG